MNDESRPQAAPESSTRTTTFEHTALMPSDAWATYLDGYRAGYVDGIDRGRQLADDEATALWSEAHKVVMAMARLDPHVERERRRRERQVDAAQRHDENARPWAREAS